MQRAEQTSDLGLEVKVLTFTEKGISEVGKNPPELSSPHSRTPFLLQVSGNNSPSFHFLGFLSLHLGTEGRKGGLSETWRPLPSLETRHMTGAVSHGNRRGLQAAWWRGPKMEEGG